MTQPHLSLIILQLQPPPHLLTTYRIRKEWHSYNIITGALSNSPDCTIFMYGSLCFIKVSLSFSLSLYISFSLYHFLVIPLANCFLSARTSTLILSLFLHSFLHDSLLTYLIRMLYYY